MPNKHGPGTHRGYKMPPCGDHSEGYCNVLRIVYGNCRADEYPGEDPDNKARCARIARSAADKSKYG